jgi:topoisomerase-4 subunit A
VFSKRSLQNTTVDFEEFIAVKGIKAIGNQLTTDKIKQVNLLEPHPYEAPVLDAIEVEEDHLDATNTSQPKLF